MKIRTDSLENELKDQQQYWEGVQRVLKGDLMVKLDTTQVEVPKEEINR